jgi:hypothetical protein
MLPQKVIGVFLEGLVVDRLDSPVVAEWFLASCEPGFAKKSGRVDNNGSEATIEKPVASLNSGFVATRRDDHHFKVSLSKGVEFHAIPWLGEIA